MDNVAIKDAIEELVNDDTTQNNVNELASLIIVNQYLNEQDLSRNSSELNDVLPAYNKYVESKRKYQLGQDNEAEMIHHMQLLCKEIQEFIEELYSNTSTLKERREISHIIEVIYTKINKKHRSKP